MTQALIRFRIWHKHRRTHVRVGGTVARQVRPPRRGALPRSIEVAAVVEGISEMDDDDEDDRKSQKKKWM